MKNFVIKIPRSDMTQKSIIFGIDKLNAWNERATVEFHTPRGVWKIGGKKLAALRAVFGDVVLLHFSDLVRK